MQHIIIADNQDITRAGLLYVLSHMEDVSCQVAGDKSELIHQLKGVSESHPDTGLYPVRFLRYSRPSCTRTALSACTPDTLERRPQYRFHPQHCQCRPAGQCAYEGCKAVGNRTVP